LNFFPLKILGLFNKREKITFFGLFTLNIAGSFLEVLGIGAIIPIVTILTKPELIEKNAILSRLKDIINPPGIKEFIITLALIFLSIILIKNMFLFVSAYIQSWFLNKKYLSISSKLYSAYLKSPYSFHLSKNTASLQQHTECVGAVINGLMFPLMTVFTESLVIVAIIIALFCIDVISTLFITIVFSLIMGIFYLLERRKLKRWGETRNYHRVKTIQQINQGLGGIKETKILHKEDYFIGQYLKHVTETVNIDHKEKVMLQVPRLYIETVTVILIVGMMLYFINLGNDPQVFLVKMSLFAVAAIRIMPSFARISTSMSTMRIYSPALDILVEDVKTAENMKIKRKEEGRETIEFNNRIELKKISFSYESNNKFNINNISLQIIKKQSVAFVGSTGAGKTTVVDIITGLLTPSSGTVEVDDKDIHGGLMSWQKQIGYVPQAIYLTDDPIKSNVAFGVEDDEMDENKIWNALELAQIGDFIKKLPEGINTLVGERGARISGGEKQRIGIARALYHNPEILVMDEATSSLDNETERAFMDTIKNLSGKKTIILIAHRLTTIQHCDKIFFLDKGRLLAEGTYQELLDKCPEFRRMAGVGQMAANR
jgi:ATP-binding cassette subfamily C protein